MFEKLELLIDGAWRQGSGGVSELFIIRQPVRF